jgi:hypothetical protein
VWLDPAITKFVPHAHAEKPIFNNDTWKEMKKAGQKVLVGECPNVVYFHRNEKFVANRWLYEDKINWGCSKDYGGCRTVMLPSLRILFLLGFRKVYLLGADFNMTEEYAYHFDEKRERGAVKCNMNTYKRMRDEYFPQLKPYFKDEGFEVYNCNPDSGLRDVFEYCSFEDAIAEATGKLGEVANERTWGMYCKPGDKHKTAHEVEEHEKKHIETLANRGRVLAGLRGENISAGSSRPVQQQVHRPEPGPVHRPEPSPAPVITEPIPPPTGDKGYRVVGVENPPDPMEFSVSSQGRIIDRKSDTNIKQVSVEPEVERIEEVPKSPVPLTGQVTGERRLIKHLPFRS